MQAQAVGLHEPVLTVVLQSNYLVYADAFFSQRNTQQVGYTTPPLITYSS